MSDFLIELGANPTARKMIKGLGLPLPMPQRLARSTDPIAERPLEGRVALFGAAAGSDLAATLAPILGAAGAQVYTLGAVEPGPWTEAAEAWGRPASHLGDLELEEGVKPAAIVFDATGVDSAASLKCLHVFFKPIIRRIAKNGRIVVLTRTPAASQPVAVAAARRAVEGFVRSIAKEVGAKGATANLLNVNDGAEDALAGPLRFFLSVRSAFVTGQKLVVSRTVKRPAVTPLVGSLDGKIALVTGAARGIGKATAACLAREGAKVLLLDRPGDSEPLAESARQIDGVPVPCDVTAADAADVIRAALAEHGDGKVDIIVHNAGVTRDKTLARMDDGQWDLTLSVNLEAIINLTEELKGDIAKGGRVIALSSTVGISGNFGQVNYATSKAGVIGYTLALAPKLARRGVSVNAIAPGFIETRLTAAIPVATREVARRLSALAQGGLPQDVAEAITFLATPASVGVTGQVLRVCGGNFTGA